MIESVGRSVRESLEGLGSAGRIAMEAVRALRDVRTWGPLLTDQMRRLGVGSLPIGILIAAFMGIVLALLASYSFTNSVPRYLVGTLVQKTIMMELAPVLTGLALAGRVGASIAAEIGTMRVTEQVDALETLAYDPISYLVVPRMLAGLVMFPVVVGVAMMIGLIAGWWASMGLLDMSSVQFALNQEVALPPNPVLLLGASSLFGEWQATVTGRQSVPANKDLYAQLADASGDKDGALPGAVLPDIAQLTSVAGGIAGDVAATAKSIQLAFNDSAARELRSSIHSVKLMSDDLARTVSVQSKNLDTVALDVRSGAVALSKASDAFLR